MRCVSWFNDANYQINILKSNQLSKIDLEDDLDCNELNSD